MLTDPKIHTTNEYKYKLRANICTLKMAEPVVSITHARQNWAVKIE